MRKGVMDVRTIYKYDLYELTGKPDVSARRLKFALYIVKARELDLEMNSREKLKSKGYKKNENDGELGGSHARIDEIRIDSSS